MYKKPPEALVITFLNKNMPKKPPEALKRLLTLALVAFGVWRVTLVGFLILVQLYLPDKLMPSIIGVEAANVLLPLLIAYLILATSSGGEN